MKSREVFADVEPLNSPSVCSGHVDETLLFILMADEEEQVEIC